MPSVDERIVEMRFENEQFEKGVKESQASLERLKSSLRLEDSARSVANSLEEISSRFSFAGVAIDQLTRNITNSFYSMATNLKNQVMDLSFNQIGVGFNKYERKLQSVQTIINATGKSIDEVNVSLDKLNWFTDETSYDFTSMVDNIGKFTSNQIPLETAVTSMIGIADAAGLAGASVTDASHAMDGFSKAMGQGYMSRQNWQWIRTAHMDTAKFKETLIDAAVEAKTLKKVGKGLYETLDGVEVTVADFETGLKDKWMNVNVMNKALAKFGGTTEKIYQQYLETGELTSDIIASMGDMGEDLGLKAFKAAQEAKTFTDAINSVKDAVSTGWMTSFEYIFGNYDEAKVMWTNLANEMWDVFNGGAEDRNELLRSWHYDFKGYESMLRSIGNIWEGIQNAILPIQYSFRQFFPKTSVDQLVSITTKFEEFSVKFKDFFGKTGAIIWPFIEEAEDIADTVGETAEAVTKKVKKVVDVVEEVEGPVSRTKKVLDELAYAVWRGDYGNGDVRVKNLRNLGYSYELVQNRVNELVEAYLGLPKGYYGRYKVAKDEIKTVTKQVEVEEEVTETIGDQIEAIKEYANEAPRKTRVAWNMKKAFTGLFSAMRLVVDAVKAVITGMTPLLKIGVQLFEILLSVASIIGQITTEVVNYIRSTGILEKVTGLLQKAFNKLSEILEPVVEWFQNAAKMTHAYMVQIKEFIGRVKELDSVQTTIKYFKDFGQTIKNTVTENFGKFVNLAKDFVKINFKVPSMEDMLKFIDDMAKGFNQFIENLKLENPTDAVSGWWSTLVTGAGGVWQRLLDTIQDPNSIFSKAYESAKQFGMGLVQGLDSLNMDTILSILSTGSLAYFLYRFATALAGATKAFKQVDLLQIESLISSFKSIMTSMAKNLKAQAFVEYAKGIGILALAMIGLGQLDKDQLANVAASITIVMLALRFLINAMSNHNFSKGARALDGVVGFLDGLKTALGHAFVWTSIGLMLVGVATSVAIFVKAMENLVDVINRTYSQDWKDAGFVLSMLGIGIGAFVTVLMEASKSMNAAQKLSLGKLFSELGKGLMFAAIGMRLAIQPMGDLLAAIHEVGRGDILSLCLILATLAASLGVLFYALGKSGKNTGVQLFSLGAGMMFMALAIKILTPLFQELWHWFTDFIHENENLDRVISLFKKLGWGFAIAAGIALIFGKRLGGLGKALTGLGIAALGIGLGIRIAGDSLEAFAKGFVGMLKIIKDNAPLVIGTVAIIVSGIITALASQKGRLIFTLVSVLMAVVDAIGIVGPDVIEAVGAQIRIAIDYTIGVMDELVDTMVYMLIAMMNSLADAIEENKQPFLDALGRLIGAMGDLFGEAIERLIPGISDGFKTFAGAIGLFTTAAIPAVKLLGGINEAFKKIKITASTVKSFGKNTFDFVKSGLFGVTEAFDTGKGFTAYAKTSMGISGVLNKVFNLTGQIGSGYAAYSGFKELAKDLGKPGILVSIAAITTAMYGIGKALQNIRDAENEEIRQQHALSSSHRKYIDRMISSYEDYKEKTDEMNQTMANIVNSHKGYEALAEEYDKLIDGTGKVKEGNEEAADTILTTLSNALGIEKEQLQDLVTEHGNLQNAIKETIRLKEAEAFINELQDEYVDAMSKQGQLQTDETIGRYLTMDAEEKLKEAQKVRDQIQVERDKYANATTNEGRAEYDRLDKMWMNQGTVVEQLTKNYDELSTEHEHAAQMLADNQKLIKNYEGIRDAYISGEAKSIDDMLRIWEADVPASLKTAANATKEELIEQANLMTFGYKKIKEAADNGSADVTEAAQNNAKSLIATARNELLRSFGLFDESGKFSADAYTDSVKNELMKASPEAYNYVETYLVPALKVDTSESGKSTGETYKAGLFEALTSTDDTMAQIESIKSLFHIETAPEGEESANNYISGIVDQLSTGEVSLDTAIDMLTSHFDLSTDLYDQGKENVESNAKGMSENSDVVETAAEEVVNDGVDSGKNVASTNMPLVGKHADLGIASGLYDYADRVEAAASYVASLIPKDVRAILRERSPSRVGKEIGKFWNLGLAGGMVENASVIHDGTKKIGNIMIDSMRNAVATAYSYLSGAGDLNPTITPVLDLSNIQNGTNTINGMFANTRSFALASANGVRFEQNRADALMKIDAQTTNADVVAALGLLRGDVTALNDSMLNTQVVLDSGALVGATAKQMDNALGRFKTLKGRGI